MSKVLFSFSVGFGNNEKLHGVLVIDKAADDVGYIFNRFNHSVVKPHSENRKNRSDIIVNRIPPLA